MPTIAVNRDELFKRLGRTYSEYILMMIIVDDRIESVLLFS